MYSIIIRGGTIHDGRGGPPFTADLAIRDDRIAAIGDLSGEHGREEIDGSRKLVAPGFIDIHSHADLHVLFEKQSLPKMRQGVTTEVIGNCGLAPVPVREEDMEGLREYLAGVLGDYPVSFRGTTMAMYLDELERKGTGVNIVPLAAHGAMRRKVMGFLQENPGMKAREALKEELKAAFDAGCHGMSTGLAYPPAFFARPEELSELARMTAAVGGIFSIHMRSEGTYLLESVDEALAIAEKTGVSLQISHLKAYGSKNWHKTEKALEKIKGASDRGLKVHFDSYPYTFGSTTLAALLPPSLLQHGRSIRSMLDDRSSRAQLLAEIIHEREGTENYAVIAGWHGLLFAGGVTEKNRMYEGESIAAIAADMKRPPEEALLSLLMDEGGSAGMLILGMNEDRVAAIARHRLHMVGSDGLYGRKPHPRTYGAFTRFLEKYVKEEKIISTAEAIRQMTGAPAEKLGLRRRGAIEKGYYADLVVIDFDGLHDRSTVQAPCQFPDGVLHVFVNGVMTVKNGEPCAALPGRVLRKNV